MQFTLSTVLAVLAATASGAVLKARIDGCPDVAPWPQGNPGDFWYAVCCPYTLDPVDCCNRDSPKDIVLGETTLKRCDDPTFGPA